MKTQTSLLRSLILATSLLAPVLALAQAKPAEPFEAAVEKAVLETNAKMAQAANRLDVDGFFAYILDTDKGLIIQNGTVFKTRTEAMEAVKRGFMGVAKMDRRFENPQVTVISPDTALLASEGSVSATLTDGREISSRFAVSVVFVRKAGQWKVLHGHYSMPANRM